MKTFTIGRTKYSENHELQFAFYVVGDNPYERIAITAKNTETGEPSLTITCNFPELEVNPGHVWVKSWGENQGVLAAMIEAKIGTLTGRRTAAGHVTSHELKLSDAVFKEARRCIAELRKLETIAKAVNADETPTREGRSNNASR